jgi:hypothetical protein
LTNAVALALAFGGLSVSAKTILLVPQDDRPVSLSYTVDTAEKAGYTVLTPPVFLLSGKNFKGNPERIWDWVSAHMAESDAAVLSTDTLIYGGLVDSRKHTESTDTLIARADRLRRLHENFPHIPLYAFGTIMRTPYASSSGVEPPYYAKYGTTIYKISGLQDKMDAGTITKEESAELLSLKLSVPVEYLQDWFKRRTKNTLINEKLIRDVKDGVFTYFILGFDDSSQYSQSTLEHRYLSKEAKSLPAKKYGSFPGADQLALLLIARYHVDDNGLKPVFSAIYPLGRAEDTVPSYESQEIGKTIEQHVTAAGGVLRNDTRPDFLLAVNTPLANTKESAAFQNFGMEKDSTLNFIKEVKRAEESGIPIAFVDVYFANGADNTLMKLIKRNGMLYTAAAYNGWNTASNTIGYSVAQAILSQNMSEQDRENMLLVQYVDNWAYQANVRKNILRISDYSDSENKTPDKLREETVAELQEFAKKELEIDPARITASYPWNRFFEIEAKVNEMPCYPVYQTRAEKQRIAEEKARKEAEEKAKKEAEEAAKKKAKEGKQTEDAEKAAEEGAEQGQEETAAE